MMAEDDRDKREKIIKLSAHIMVLTRELRAARKELGQLIGEEQKHRHWTGLPRLVERLIRQSPNTQFTIPDIKRELVLDDVYSLRVRTILSRLTRAGLIQRVKTGVYQGTVYDGDCANQNER